MPELEFTKAHGCGNDFVLVDNLAGTDTRLRGDRLSALSRRLCDRRFGIGSDGLITLEQSAVAEYRMRMFNPDGTEAQMCGNGIRCFGVYLVEHGIHRSDTMTVETGAGVLTLTGVRSSASGGEATVSMGAPVLRRSQIPVAGPDSETVVGEQIAVLEQSFEFTAVSMGNPHAVLFSADYRSVDIAAVGPAVERHEMFPQRTNVHAATVNSPSDISMKTWERGAGVTLACGTGACAVVVAAHLRHGSSRRAAVHLPGGDLAIDWTENGPVLMTGPAVIVYTGAVDVGS